MNVTTNYLVEIKRIDVVTLFNPAFDDVSNHPNLVRLL